jgi:hypothetical protein
MCEPTLHDLEAIALQVLAELSRIRELLERREAGEPDLLRSIHHACRSTEFTTPELLRHAALPANSDLQRALECEFDDPNSRRIGKFLASIAGRPIGGFMAERIGQEREGAIWRVRVCPDKLASPVAPGENVAHAEDSHDGGIRKCGCAS